MAYEDFKDLTKKTTSEKILLDKELNIGKIPKYDGYQRGLASIVYKFFDKKSSGSGINIENILNKDGKSVATERFIRSLNNKIHTYMTSISKNAYIDKLDFIASKYNNTYKTIKMKPVDIKLNIYINTK